jgi:hypothetical protein
MLQQINKNKNFSEMRFPAPFDENTFKISESAHCFEIQFIKLIYRLSTTVLRYIFD